MRMSVIRGAGMVCLATLSLGCARTLTVEAKGTRAMEAPLPAHVTYIVLPTQDVEQDPSFPEYAQILAQQLDQAGYRPGGRGSARLAVYLGYYVSEPRMAQRSLRGSPTMGGGGGSGSGGGGGYGTGPMGGTSSTVETQSRYAARLVIVIADLEQSQASGSVVELWRGESTMTGSSPELRPVAPLLIEAALRHLGETTPKPVEHTFSEEHVSRAGAPSQGR